MRTIAIVPMKLNNERLPNKNTKAFTNGKSLCFYILSTLLQVRGIDAIYVYCSNPVIKKYIPEGIRFLERSPALDSTNTTMNEVLKSFAKDVPADLYIMSHATSPFIKPESIQDALNRVLAGEYDSALAVEKVQEFFWKENQPFNYSLDSIPRTQDLDVMYKETSGFYIYKSESIMDYNRRVGIHPFLKEVSKIEAVDIDEREDFEIADAIFQYGRKG